MAYPQGVATGNAVIRAAIDVIENWETGGEDRSDCPYNLRGLVPGADPHGSCSYGCQTEPDCHTSGPYPMTALKLAVDAHRAATAVGHVQGPDMDAT